MAFETMNPYQRAFKFIFLALVLSGLMPLCGQTNPSKEYIRLGDRVIAIENATASSGSVSFGTPTSGTSLVVGSGTGSVTVNSTLGSGQPWSVTSNATWFHLNSGSSGTGSPGGTIQYSWDANSGNARPATLTLNPGSVTLQFNQAGVAGTLTLLPTSATLNSTASNQTIQVSSNVNWTAAVTSPNSSWLTVGTPSGVAPSSTLSYSVAGNNTGAQRAGTITVTAGSNQQTFTVTQNAMQSLTVGPVSVVLSYGAQYVFTAYIDGTAVPASSVSWSVQIISGQAGTFPQPGVYLAPSVGSNNYVKATYGSFTSNFATVQVVSSTAGPSIETFSPTSGTGNGTTVSIVTKDPTGVNNDLQYVEFGFAQNPNAPSQNGDCALIVGPYVPISPAFVNYLQTGASQINFPNSTAPNLHWSSVNCDVTVSQATTSRNDTTNEITFNLPIFFHTGTASASKTIWVWPISRHGLGPQTWASEGTYVITGAAAVGPVSPQGGVGSTQVFTGTYTKGANATSLKSAEILIGSSTNTAGACDVRYDNVGHLFYLRNDAGTGWTTGIAQGSSQTIQNSQCIFSGTGSSASGSSTLTVVANVTFTTSFFGPRFVYLEAVDSNNADSGYQQQGYWTVDQPPTTVSVTPSSGTGSSQLFNFTYSDLNGATDLTDLKAMLNTSSTLGGCAVRYTRSGNGLYLYSSGAWVGPYVPGSNNSPSSSSCTLNVAQSSITSIGNIVTVNAALSFPTAFAGAKNIYLDALDAETKEATFGTVYGTYTVVQTIPIVLTTLPSGLSLSADGGGCTAPCTFQWVPGSAHTITASTSPQSGGTGIQYVWANWSDAGAASHQITVPASAATYTANFTTQYYLTTSASPSAGGTISPTSAWYNSGTVVAVGATANSGYIFSGFSGAITGITTPQNVTMTGPASVTATYTTGGGLQVATPTFSPVAGTYSGAQNVVISTTTSGASIRYTTDGVTTPTETVGTLYTGAVPVATTTTIKAIAYSTGMTDSAVASATYTVGQTISRVQYVHQYPGATATFASNNTAGNTIIVEFSWSGSTENPTISDSQGNTYQAVGTFGGSPPSGADVAVQIWYASNIHSGPNTITIGGTVNDGGLTAFEYSGIKNSSPVDVTSALIAPPSSTSTPTSNSFTTTANDLVFSVFADETTVQSSITAGTSNILISADGGHIDAEEEQLNVSSGTYSSSFNLGTASNSWMMYVVAFKAGP